MENEIISLSDNEKVALAFKAGAARLEAIIESLDECVNVDNVVLASDPNANVFKFQHRSGRVYNLTQRVFSRTSHRYEIVWGLVTCSMNGTLYNLTNLRRHSWSDWLTDETIGEKWRYGWFRFHGKRLWTDACVMVVNVYDDGKVEVDKSYDRDFINRLLNDTQHLADNIKQKDLKADSNYISGNYKRKQMLEVVNSVMAIEGPAECIKKAFDSGIFKLVQTVEQDNTILFDEINTAKVTVMCKAVLPAYEDRTAFNFRYKLTVNTQDYTTKCNENQEIDLYVQNAEFEVQQVYKGAMPFTLKFNLVPNKEKYTQSKWRDYKSMKLGEIGFVNATTGKSIIQEFADGYNAMKPITDAVKGVC